MARILIVDDEKSIRITLRAFLSAEGHDVEVAGDVAAALELLDHDKFDVVVSDIILPRVTGVSLLKQLRESAPDVQVIMMTGEPTLETAIAAVRAGACDYLTKPVSKAAIIRAVANATTIKKLTDEKRSLEAKNREYQNNLQELVKQRTKELEETLEELKTAQTQLVRQERMNALGQMASGIAHDFNNVLMPIMGFSEILLERPETWDNREETIEMLEGIHSAGADARHIVRRLREIYKEEEPDHGPVSLDEVLKSVIALTKPKWKEEMNARGTSVEVLTDLADVPMINGNASELREAFTNVIFNAVAAMPDGGTLTVALRAEDGMRAVVEFTDTGLGMDETTANRCIEPFFTTKGEQGTGLGLPMAYGVVQRHGGSVRIESSPNEGTMVQMRFPVAVEGTCSDDTLKEDVAPLPPMKVLVVDDEQSSRHIVKKILESDGHTVVLATDAVEGLEMFRESNFDLVVTDRAMPSASGDEVAAEIARERHYTPVIMLTGFGDIMKDAGECPPGVAQVMSKPVTRTELRRVMTAVMSKDAGQAGSATTGSEE